MSWTLTVAILVFLVGLCVLFAMTWRLFTQVRSLGRTVATMSAKLAESSAELAAENALAHDHMDSPRR